MSAEEETSTAYSSRQDDDVPVQNDADNVEDPIDEETADSDKTLEADDKDAIDKDNIVEGRTRHATKPGGTYQEPDEDDLPEQDGSSSVAQ